MRRCPNAHPVDRRFQPRPPPLFTVASRPPGYGRIDHDWMFDDPELFESHLDALGLKVLSRSGSAA